MDGEEDLIYYPDKYATSSLQVGETICDFYNPQNRQGKYPGKDDFWNYASSTCYSSYPASTTKSFSDFTYGDILIILLLFIMILGSCFGFIIRHFLNFKK